MRFLIDAQLPPGLATFLELQGHQAEHVARIGLGAASDIAIFAHAKAVQAALITKDADFLTLAANDRDAPPVVWVRVGNTTNASLRSVFGRALAELVLALEARERVVEIS
ncbi:DUF5615 family PIN-like protein [Jiella sp. M17.18]|uniref:DUF5615 family PIN-like protein n=1 Tax=Jiella sp. M17.18 TaxID=3234247 RepID=UPI0034DFCA25